MADITQFTSSPPSFEGRHVVTEFVTEMQYANIADVSNPASPNFDTGAANYDPQFASTLYYIRENA